MCIERNKAVPLYEQRIHERDMGNYTHGQTALVNTNKNETEDVTEHAHTYRNTCNTLTLTRFLVQPRREIVGCGRFRDCWLVPKKQGASERDAIVRTVRHEAGRCSFRDSGPNSNPYARERRAHLRGRSWQKSQSTDRRSLGMMAEKDEKLSAC
jgi:hypothetical protein